MDLYTTDSYDITRKNHFPTALFKLTIAIIITLLFLINYQSLKTQARLSELLKKELKADQLSDDIIYFDEVLTMSARLAVLTGDSAWQQRYIEYEQKLEATLLMAQKEMPEAFKLTLASQMVSQANEKLVEIEKKSFILLSKGKLEQAKILLFGTKYQKYKLMYAKGMLQFQHKVHQLLVAQGDASARNAIYSAFYSVCCIFILIVISALLFRRATQWQNKQNSDLQALYKNSRNYHLILSSAGEGIYGLDNKGNTTFVNDAACKILGYQEDELIGKPMHLTVHYAYPDGSTYPREECPMYAAFNEGKVHHVEDEVLWHKSGKAVPVRYTSTPIFDGNKIEGAVVTFLDTTQEQKVKQALKQQAHFDTLTGLPNRHSFAIKLEQAINYAQREQCYFAVMFIDMDDFKLINDSKGHDFGDNVICELAKRIRSKIRTNDYLARIGGDEFAAVFEHFDKVEAIGHIAKNVLNDLKTPLNIDGVDIKASISLGIAVYPTAAKTSSELLKKADIAMYRAKELGKGQFVFYEAKLHQQIIRMQAIEKALSTAIKNNEFAVHYQPIFDSDKKPLKLEALIRWQNKLLQNPSPSEFIAIAEQSSLINDIGQWVINTVLMDIGELQKLKGFEFLKVAINISAKQLASENFYEITRQAIDKSKVDSRSIILEITETALMANIEQSSVSLEKIRQLGVKLALDDFGTGYSSMLYLKKLPIQYLKIDRAFVRDIGVDESDAAIVKAIIDLSSSFGLKAIAEGIETDEQLQFLKSNQCDLFQGFLLAKPMPKADIVRLLVMWDIEKSYIIDS